MSQCCLCSSFRTSLALGEADGVPGPVIHQLMQVISEGALALLGVWGRRSGSSRLGEGSRMVLAVAWTICGAGPAWSWETRREVSCELENKLGDSIEVAHCDKIKCLHVPVEQLLRLGMDGEDLSCCMDDLLTACDASVVNGKLCFGDDSEPWRLLAEAGDPEHMGTMACKHLPRKHTIWTVSVMKHAHKSQIVVLTSKWVLNLYWEPETDKPVYRPPYLSVLDWAVHYCELICGFCACVDLQPLPQQGRRQKKEEVFPSAWTGPLSPLSDESAKPGSPPYVCERERKGRKT